MNIPTPLPPPLNYAPGGGEIVLQGEGGRKKILRASRAFLSYIHNFWEITPPLENFLDPPLSHPFSSASFRSLCKSLSISLISLPPSLYLSLSLSLYLQISPLENFRDPPLIILLFPKPKKDIERG